MTPGDSAFLKKKEIPTPPSPPIINVTWVRTRENYYAMPLVFLQAGIHKHTVKGTSSESLNLGYSLSEMPEICLSIPSISSQDV